jgi:DNA-binding MarR family transcriptional regulator
MSSMRAERWEAALDRVLELTVLLGRDMTDSLAADLHVTPRTITALVDGLVATGFVSREPHPSDRRTTLVTFTERGRTTAQALLDGHSRLARQLFAGLPPNVFDGFDAGLVHVVTRFRGVLAAQEPRARP